MFKRLENVSMIKKVVIPAAVMLVAALGIVLGAERGLSKLAAQTHQIINVTAARQALALSMTAEVNGVAASEKNAMLMTDQTGLDAFASDYVTGIDHLRNNVGQLLALASDAGEIERLDRIGMGIEAYYATGQRLYQYMVDKHYDQAAMLSAGDSQTARANLIALIKQEADQTAADMRHADGEADALYHRTFGLLAVLSLVGLILALVTVNWITSRFILRPLTKITDSMGRISRGDFAIAIEEADRRDEIGILGRALAVFRERSIALRENTQRLKTAHDEIRALNNVLERRVEERTSALNEAHRELIVKERLSSLGELTATVAHELRNPLSTLRNTMHVIAKSVAERGVDIERQLGRCWRTIERCDGIIADLLDFAGGRELHAAAMQLDVWLSDTLDQVKLPPTIVLERQLDAPRIAVPIDSERLRCAIVNIIENAVEAIADSPEREGRIAVSTAAAGPRAEIVIADSGPGMRADVLVRVFEPLFSTRAFGTGLGMPTVKRIIEQHGGEIAVDSAPGRGTRVIVQLPLAPAKASQAA